MRGVFTGAGWGGRVRAERRKAAVAASSLTVLLAVLAAGVARAADCGPLACSQALVELPFVLDFEGDEGGVLDSFAVGTGFTYVMPTTNPEDGSPYLPQASTGDDLLKVDGGVLAITTTRGQNHSANSQNNALGVGIDAPSQVTRIETTLAPPIPRPLESSPGVEDPKNQQGGLWFGNDEDNFIKLDYLESPDGDRIEFQMQIDGQNVDRVTSPFITPDPANAVTLTMIVNPVLQKVFASYRLNGGTDVPLLEFDPPGELFSFDAAGNVDPTIGTASFGGIYATQNSQAYGDGPRQVWRFEDFSVTKEADAVEQPDLTEEGIAFDRVSYPIFFPTAMDFGPDGRLYVSELFGPIHALTLNDDHEVIEDRVYDGLTAGGPRLVLGLTVDPDSDPDHPTIWVAHSDGVLEVAEANSSKVTRLAGADFSGPPGDVSGNPGELGFASSTDVITGLPRGHGNHAVSSIHFGPDGKLWIGQGGNSGAGSPNDDPTSEFGDRGEQPLSAALLVADVKDLDGNGFDGNCDNGGTDHYPTAEEDPPMPDGIYGPPPCETSGDVVPYATGLRNTFDFVFHSNGQIYGPDNSSGTSSTFPPSPTAPCYGFGDLNHWDANPPGDAPDALPEPLNRIVQGGYYGHPNPTRGECVFFDGRFQGVAPLPNYQRPLYYLGNHASANGTIEYTSDAHCGSLKGNLLIADYSVGDDIQRIELSPDGLSVVSGGSLVGGFNDPLPLVQDPDPADGTIYVGETFNGEANGQITALVPKDIGCPLQAEAVDDDETIPEDSGANAVDVLANDSGIVDGVNEIGAVSQPAHGTVEITNGGDDLTYAPNPGYCNDGAPTDDFTYTVAPGDSTATVSITIACPPPPPTVRCVGRAATIVGTRGPDFLAGTPGDDVIVGFAGADRIRGRGGNDLICAGAGADHVAGGAGADSLFGGIGSGRDVLFGGRGRDRLAAGRGRDWLFGGWGPDLLLGGAGRDICGPGRRDRRFGCELLSRPGRPAAQRETAPGPR